MNKTCVHSDYSLKQFQSLDLDSKIRLSIARIESFYNYFNGNVYISFSGGKDSTVLLHLVRSIFPNVKAVFCDTGLEYPDIKNFVRLQNNVEIIFPGIDFYSVVKKYGYPVISKENSQKIYEIKTTHSNKLLCKRLGSGSGSLPFKYRFLLDVDLKISHKCCFFLKKRPFKIFEKNTGLKPFLGILASESRLREQQYIKNGCNVFQTDRPHSNPLSFWTEQDILEYIFRYKLKIANCYGFVAKNDDIFYTTKLNRTGCMFCMFGNESEIKNKHEFIKKEYPVIYKYLVNKLQLHKVYDICFNNNQFTFDF